MSESSSDLDTPAPRIEFRSRPAGTWAKNLTGMEAFRYRAWRAGIDAELMQACEQLIRSERGESELVEELLAASKASKPADGSTVEDLVGEVGGLVSGLSGGLFDW